MPPIRRLAKHFSVQQIIEICLNVGLAQITNRFNATFLSDVDDYILDSNKRADSAADTCPIHYPPMPTYSPRLNPSQIFTRPSCTRLPSAPGWSANKKLAIRSNDFRMARDSGAIAKLDETASSSATRDIAQTFCGEDL
jgi:hypothetical protein